MIKSVNYLQFRNFVDTLDGADRKEALENIAYFINFFGDAGTQGVTGNAFIFEEEKQSGWILSRPIQEGRTISRCYILESERGKGKGELMVNDFHSYYKDTKIRIKSKPDALGFWKKMGYHIMDNPDDGFYEGWNENSA